MGIHSCGKMDDPAEDLAWDIDTAAMYEQLGIIDEVSSALASRDYRLVDSLLVYDGQGNLIARQGMKSDAPGHKPILIPGLADGTYTFVLFQTCMKSGEPDLWTTVDAGQLATLHFNNPNACVDGVQALGVAKERVTILAGAVGAALTPRPVGSIVDFQIDNYVRESFEGLPDSYKLPPVWLYSTDHIAGYYPDSGRFLNYIMEQKKAIGYLEEGQPHHKFFLLTDGSKITASVQTDSGFSLFQDTVSLPPGSNAVCYYSYVPKNFFNAYLGTSEGAAAFKAGHSEDSFTLYPYLEWGASRDEVDSYVKNRMTLPCGDGKSFVTKEGITCVQYDPAFGLAEYCCFDSDGKLIEVTYDYHGSVGLNSVKSCMEKQGFKYMGCFTQLVYIYRLYLSADGQTELVVYPTSDVIFAVGYGCWAATFIPFNPDDLNLLEFY